MLLLVLNVLKGMDLAGVTGIVDGSVLPLLVLINRIYHTKE